MPSFWDRGSEYKIIMVDPFLEFRGCFSGSRLVSGGVAPWELWVCYHTPTLSRPVSAGLIPKDFSVVVFLSLAIGAEVS